MTEPNELLRQLRSDIEELKFQQYDRLDALRRRVEMVIRNTFGQDSKYLNDLEEIRFSPLVWASGMTDDDARPSWKSGQSKLLNLIDTMMEELKLFGPSASEDSDEAVQDRIDEVVSNKVFVVHGHDEEMKQAVARTLERLDLEPLILHEQPSQGRTIIEKLMDHSAGVSFAVVLLSPDDLAYEGDEDPSTARYRARQNVVLELGFFLGRLGRSRVAVLHRRADRFEIPSDYSGVLYIPYDDRGTWQFEIARELRAAGFELDTNKIV